MKRYLLLALVCGLTLPAVSQSAADALRYAYLNPSGGARYVGAGGAFGALGAEFATLSQNPAGLAMYRSNELAFTPGLRFANTDAALPNNESWDDDRSNFYFDHVGLVFNSNPNGRWKTFNVGIGLNRQATFNQAIYYEGAAPGSIMTGFFNEAAGVINGGGSENDLYPFGARLAWDANAIYFIDNALTYDFDGYENAAVDRTHTVSTFGGVNELVIGLAGNYDEKLMLGATVGVPIVNYRIEGEYTESDAGGGLEGNVPYFDYLSYTEYLRSQGVGVNFKLGLIYRITQSVRLGAAFHTPTLLGITDEYSNTFQYAYEDANGPSVSQVLESPQGNFDYRLRTPWRAMLGTAFVVGKNGFVSADLEWVDYGASRFDFNPGSPSAADEQAERAVNRDIQRNYQQAMNVRLGGELALDNFRLRAGVNLQGNPNEGSSDFRTAYTAGAGLRADAFFLDLGFRRTVGDGQISPYAGSPAAEFNVRNNELLLTIGFKF